MKERTFCKDENGREIFIGDTVLISMSARNPATKQKPFNGAVPAPFKAKVLPNRNGIFGFRVKYGKGYLVFEDDGQPCWEVKVCG